MRRKSGEQRKKSNVIKKSKQKYENKRHTDQTMNGDSEKNNKKQNIKINTRSEMSRRKWK